MVYEVKLQSKIKAVTQKAFENLFSNFCLRPDKKITFILRLTYTSQNDYTR